MGQASSSECLRSERLHFWGVFPAQSKELQPSRLCSVWSGVVLMAHALGQSREVLPAVVGRGGRVLAGRTELSRECCATHPPFHELWVLRAHTWEAHEAAETNLLHFLCTWLCRGRGRLLH